MKIIAKKIYHLFYNYIRKVGVSMRIEGSYSRPYASENAKRVAANAASSAILSAGLTYAFNKGQDPKHAAKVGLIVAGISLVLDLVRSGFDKIKAKKESKYIDTESQALKSKMQTHQG